MARPKRSTSVELVNEGSEDAPRKAPAVRTSKTRAIALAKTENKIENMVRSMFTNSLKEVERVVKLTDSSSVIADRVSTGSASLDLTLGGGLAPGFHQYSGEEASGKTTGGLMFLASAIRDPEIGSTVFFDAENSGGADPDYLESVLRTSGATDVKASEVFGVKDSKGVTLVEPRIYYRDDNEGEKFFAWLAAIQRRMPDKRYVGGNWWYVYENTQKIKAALGDAVNVPMTRSANGGLYVPAEHGKPQLVVLLDSLPALLPEAADEDDPSKGIAIMARMFSTGMRAIKGRMRRKRVILVGVNQLSTNPMQMYGPKDSEKGGNALKYYSDSRTRFKARSSGMPYNPTLEGGIQREASAEFDGRKDTYRYIHVRNNKNKLGKPFRETWLRLWAEDGVGKARGYDPAWDVLQYLSQTGQVTGVRANLKIILGGDYVAKRGLNIADFKALVLADKTTRIEMFAKLGFPKPVDLRTMAFRQLASGKAEDLYLQHAYAKKGKGDDDESGGGA